MEKFWTVLNGVLGTAHNARDGRTVDFRPAERIEGTQAYSSAVGQLAPCIKVHPPKGQKLEVLVLEPTRIEKVVDKVDYPHRGQQWVNEVLYAEYMDVEISTTHRHSAEWYDLEAEEMFRLEEERKRADWKAQEDEERKFVESISQEELINKTTSREIGRLRAGTMEVRDIVARILREEFEKRFKNRDSYRLISKEIGRRNLDEFKTQLLAADDRRREERKQQWLTKSR